MPASVDLSFERFLQKSPQIDSALKQETDLHAFHHHYGHPAKSGSPMEHLDDLHKIPHHDNSNRMDADADADTDRH